MAPVILTATTVSKKQRTKRRTRRQRRRKHRRRTSVRRFGQCPPCRTVRRRQHPRDPKKSDKPAAPEPSKPRASARSSSSADWKQQLASGQGLSPGKIKRTTEENTMGMENSPNKRRKQGPTPALVCRINQFFQTRGETHIEVAAINIPYTPRLAAAVQSHAGSAKSDVSGSLERPPYINAYALAPTSTILSRVVAEFRTLFFDVPDIDDQLSHAHAFWQQARDPHSDVLEVAVSSAQPDDEQTRYDIHGTGTRAIKNRFLKAPEQAAMGVSFSNGSWRGLTEDMVNCLMDFEDYGFSAEATAPSA